MAVLSSFNYRKDILTGLAADTKPTTARQGAMFYEMDTGLWYVFDGTNWVRFYGY